MSGPDGLEFLLVSVHGVNNGVNNNHNKVYVGIWYRPPANSAAIDTLYSALENLDVNILSSFVLLGDFNIDFCNSQHFIFSKLSNILNSFVLTQVVTQPTHISPSRTATLIDLALLSTLSQMVSCDVIPPLGNSDHNGIGLLLNWSSKPPSVKAKQRSIWKYDHADFDKANRVISDADWSFLKDQIDVDVAWDLWEQKFLSIMEECIPKGTVPTRQNLPRLNMNITFKIRKRNSMYRKARSTTHSSHWRKYTTLRNEVVKLFKEVKEGIPEESRSTRS